MNETLKRANDKLKGIASKAIVATGAVVSLSSNALAADPTWFTDLTTSMSAISIMAGTALAAVITVKLVPLAWRYIAPIIGRG